MFPVIDDTSLQDCRNSKFGKIELYEPQDSPINSASLSCRVVFLSAFMTREQGNDDIF